jgi:hypothetical protein
MRRIGIMVCLVVLAGCTSNAEIAAKRCAGTSGGTYDQCVAREQAKLATAQQLPTGGGGGY